MELKSSLFLVFILCTSTSIDQVFSQKRLDNVLKGFTKKFIKQVNSLNEEDNFVISPIAIQRQLLLAMQGAHNTTYDEIQKIIGVDGMDESTYIEELAKRPDGFICNDNIYKSKSVQLRKPFRVLSDLLFDVIPDEIDFEDASESANKISDDVEVATNGLIRKAIRRKDLSDHTSICFLNNVFLSERWAIPFNKRSLRIGKFYNHGKFETTVSALYGVHQSGYAVLNNLGATAISLSYADSAEKLLILLPHDSDGLKRVFEKAMRIDFPLLLRKLKWAVVALTLPIFSVDYRADLSKILPKLGAKELVSPNADFENVFENPQPSNKLCLFSIAHFDINKHGSSVEESNSEPEEKEHVSPENFFLVEHPFIFFIYNNDTIHFFGRVVAINLNTEEPDDK